uniref:Uncharacterized protein n=1 Tax=Anguilla anguilla TaxID=7936 RepID=A0A0E9QES5_ANGAN
MPGLCVPISKGSYHLCVPACAWKCHSLAISVRACMQVCICPSVCMSTISS